MSLSLYDFGNWQANTEYNVHDYYRYNNFVYYAIRKHNSGGSFNPDYSDGVELYNGQNRAKFFWIPSYNAAVDIKPFVKETKFGDSYAQRSVDGINNIMLGFSLGFDKRTDAEARAILHFLNQRKAVESFVFIPPFPYNTTKLFTCPSWKHTTVFLANHTIECQFIESVT